MARHYEVVGTRPYRGHSRGECFAADLSEEQEARAIERGSIRPVATSADLQGLKRPELNQLARQAGVPNPEGLPNKTSVELALGKAAG